MRACAGAAVALAAGLVLGLSWQLGEVPPPPELVLDVAQLCDPLVVQPVRLTRANAPG